MNQSTEDLTLPLPNRFRRSNSSLITLVLCSLALAPPARAADPPETLATIGARLYKETTEAYTASPYSALSKDYFNRFSRDPDAKPAADEVEITNDWAILIPDPADPLTELMAGHLADFLKRAMGIDLKIERKPYHDLVELMQARPWDSPGYIVLAGDAHDGGGTPHGYTFGVYPRTVALIGPPAGVRDGIVHLVDLIGSREAPYLKRTQKDFTPRLPVRLGVVPYNGTVKDLVFLGYNAVFSGGGSLFALSTSGAIPELKSRRSPGLAEANAKAAAEPRRYGLKTYGHLDMRQKFPKNDPVLLAHPEIRGSLTWSADGEYTLCTEHPLVKQYLAESMEGIFKADPQLDGVSIIVGGEGFYHCFMRPFGVAKGHTNCPRCEAIGANQVVANLCNLLAESARKANPKAEVVIWPYSAHIWSDDKDQSGLLKLLNPGVALLTEIEKDEIVEKGDGVQKLLWDYSIDLIGPGQRAKNQIAICKQRGIPVYLKSEPELGFEAPRLPHIPCMDRWVDRAEALASCGATGAWVFPAFRPLYGTSAAEINKHFWWDPAEPKEEMLGTLAARLAGKPAAPAVREAWRNVSEAINYSPEIPPYYTGPYYLGPAHPMCADPAAELPQVFYGYYLYLAEATDAEGAKKHPTFVTKPSGKRPVFLKLYRKMEATLKKAADGMTAARPLVDARHKLMFDAEDSPVQWFYRTARTEANFYESCILRDRLLKQADDPARTPEETAAARTDATRWLEVLKDERENTIAALPIMQADPRLDFRYGGDHTFEHGADMIHAKLELIDREINTYVPSVAARFDDAKK